VRLGPERAPQGSRKGRKRRWLTLAAATLFLLGWAGLFFGAGFTYRDFVIPSLRSLTGATSLSEILDNVGQGPVRWLRAHTDAVEVPKLHIDIKFKHLRKLHAKREEALRQQLLVTTDDDFVPAEVRHDGRSIPVRLRLKGDLTDHFEGDKWSLRVKTRGGAAILGMRRFSLQAPRTRGFQSEPIFLESLRWLGVLAPRYSFVEVEINGTDIGLMALEEHFDKVLLESQGRRESVILKFDESSFWENQLFTNHHHPYDDYRHAPVEAFRMGSILRSPALMRDLGAARGLLRGFAEGELTASEAFDEALLGRLLAACEVWAASHPCRWHNLRFYFNPIDRELEPIAFDGNLHDSWLSPTLISAYEPIARDLLQDPGVQQAYRGGIRELAEGLDGGELLSRLQAIQDRDLAILHREFPLRSPLDISLARRRAAQLRDLDLDALFELSLPPHGERGYPTSVLANLIHGERGPELQLASALPYPVRVEGVQVTRVAATGESSITETLAGFPIELPATRKGLAPEWRSVPLPLKAELENLRVTGVSRIQGYGETQTFTARNSHPAARAPALPHVDTARLIEDHRFLQPSAKPGYLEIIPGSWTLEETLILPAGVGLRIAAGTQLRFSPEASLVVRGPTDFAGREDAPIRLEALSAERTWPGLVVLNAASESHWSHVQVRNTHGFSLGDWVLTGAVTFFSSDAFLSHCSFQENSGEDALNIISSRFRLEDITVTDAASDGFDGDFTRGEIRGGLFARIGGDGIDVSGSNVAISGTRLQTIRDKALSIGEGSEVVATDLQIDDVGSAVVAKDASLGIVRNSSLRNIQHSAFMAYQKKPEFGPGRLTVEEVAVESAEQLAVTQWGSQLSIDGVNQPEMDFDVEAAYESGPMQK